MSQIQDAGAARLVSHYATKRGPSSGSSPAIRKAAHHSDSPAQSGAESGTRSRTVFAQLADANSSEPVSRLPIVFQSPVKPVLPIKPEPRPVHTDPNPQKVSQSFRDKWMSRQPEKPRPSSESLRRSRTLVRKFELEVEPKVGKAVRDRLKTEKYCFKERTAEQIARQERALERSVRELTEREVGKLTIKAREAIVRDELRQRLVLNLTGNSRPTLIDVGSDVSKMAIKAVYDKIVKRLERHPTKCLDFEKSRNKLLGDLGEFYFKARMEMYRGKQVRTYIDANAIRKNFFGIDGFCQKMLYSLKTYTGESALGRHQTDLRHRQDYVTNTTACFQANLGRFSLFTEHLPDDFETNMRTKIDASFYFVILDNHFDALEADQQRFCKKMGVDEAAMLVMLETLKSHLAAADKLG